MGRDKEQQLGWAKEAVAGTDPIDAVNADYWKFGINTNKFDYNHPIETHDYVAHYRGDHRYPADLSLIATEASEIISFYPVNLVPFYLILATGATHTAAAGTNNEHTITPSEPGTALETFTVRSESRIDATDAQNKYISMVGCKAKILTINFNRLKLYDRLVASLAYVGFETKTPTLNEKHTTGTKLPTIDGAMTGTEVNSMYKYDTNFEFRWDSATDDVDYDIDLLNYNCQIIQNFNVEGKEGQADIAYVDEGTYSFLVGFQLRRGTDKSIYDDFLAQGSSPDEHLYMKMMAGATNYIRIEHQDVGLSMCKGNYAKFETKNQTIPTWDVMGIAENIQIKGKDQLSPTAAQNKFFGESL